jgi:hypothetical protein
MDGAALPAASVNLDLTADPGRSEAGYGFTEIEAAERVGIAESAERK